MTHPNCKCSMTTRLVGDGCQWCNINQCRRYLQETMDDLGERDGEIAELRAYKERTEAALREFSGELSTYGGVPTNYYREELRRLGLWREGGA